MFITSIKQLFINIVAKSEELMDRLNVCVKEHTQLTALMTSFQDWITAFRDETQTLAETVGEKAETRKKLTGFSDVLGKNEQGRGQLEEILRLCAIVVSSTSPRGCEILHKITANLQEELDTLTSSLQEMKKNLEVRLMCIMIERFIAIE